MIDIHYDRESNSTKVYTKNLKNLLPDEKIIAKFKNIISNEIHYEASLGSNCWCTWNGAELITDVLFYDVKGNFLFEHKWDVIRDGDEIEKKIWFYLSNRKNKGIKSNGLIIGTHDGRNGHWIYSIKNRLSNATMIDGSEKQFSKLIENYSKYNNLTFINEIVTIEGGEVVWYQGGEGYTDTVKKDLISDWLDESQISKMTSNSISFKKLIEENDFDWIHLDVEGIDGDLILSLKKYPNLIVYESMNLEKKMIDDLSNFFEINGYEVAECNGNTIALKKYE